MFDLTLGIIFLAGFACGYAVGHSQAMANYHKRK